MGKFTAALAAIGSTLLILAGCSSGGSPPQDVLWIPTGIGVSKASVEYGEDVIFSLNWPAELGELTVSWDFGGMAPNVAPVQATPPHATTVTVGDFGEDGPRSFTITATARDSEGRTDSIRTLFTVFPPGYGD